MAQTKSILNSMSAWGVALATPGVAETAADFVVMILAATGVGIPVATVLTVVRALGTLIGVIGVARRHDIHVPIVKPADPMDVLR